MRGWGRPAASFSLSAPPSTSLPAAHSPGMGMGLAGRSSGCLSAAPSGRAGTSRWRRSLLVLRRGNWTRVLGGRAVRGVMRNRACPREGVVPEGTGPGEVDDLRGVLNSWRVVLARAGPGEGGDSPSRGSGVFVESGPGEEVRTEGAEVPTPASGARPGPPAPDPCAGVEAGAAAPRGRHRAGPLRAGNGRWTSRCCRRRSYTRGSRSARPGAR